MSSLNASWSDDSTHRLNVTFAYTKWLTGRDGVTGGSTAVEQGSVPFVTNFTNEIKSIVAGFNGISNGKDPRQQLQSIKTFDAGIGNLGGTVSGAIKTFF